MGDEVELDEFEQDEEGDAFGEDNFEEDQHSSATYDIGFAHSENEDDNSIGGFDEVQSEFGSAREDDERREGGDGASPQ